MKKTYVLMALIGGVSVVCSSCVTTPGVGCSTYSVSPTAAWTGASYDASGIPIFGYSYGRPIYGYTPSGSAIYSLSALTALCYVPHWEPATWCRVPHRYPRGIRRVTSPPRFPRGHQPGIRPPMPQQGGMRPDFGRPGGHVPPPSSGFDHGFSTMPTPGGMRVAPVPRGVSPHVAPLPGVGGVEIPKPATPSGGGRNFSTMPAPSGMRVAPVPGAARPHVAPLPGVGGVSIPKPATPSGGGRNFSTMPAPGGMRVAPSPGAASPHPAPSPGVGGVSIPKPSTPDVRSKERDTSSDGVSTKRTIFPLPNGKH